MYKPLPTVLLAEDDDNAVLLLRKVFQQLKEPVSLQTVTNGEQVIKYLMGEAPYNNRDESPFPSVVLLDLKMPKKNGFEVLEWRQQQHQMKLLPMVVLTASDQFSDSEKAYCLGANSYLVKPSLFEKLVEMIRAFEKYWLTFNKLPIHH